MPPLTLARFTTKTPFYLHNPRPPRQRLPSCLLIENVSAVKPYGFSKRSRAETFPIKASDDSGVTPVRVDPHVQGKRTDLWREKGSSFCAVCYALISSPRLSRTLSASKIKRALSPSN